MGSRRPETMAKRAREVALKERRERKLAKKAARTNQGKPPPAEPPPDAVPAPPFAERGVPPALPAEPPEHG
jgi:hypothetical protein